ncbi:MAG: methyltransferase domain-containing protein [Pyrinomonadaceae bacterium]
MFKTRSTNLERIDTGDYTLAEYAVFLREIAFINRHLGDQRALRKTLLRDIERGRLGEFSLLDVGCGSGELLRIIADFARDTGRKAKLAGIDLNEISASITKSRSSDYPEVSAVRGDAFNLPFADNEFDYAISSLFFHHLTDEQIPFALKEMTRVAHRGIVVIDLERSVTAWFLYQLFCLTNRISTLVRQDGSLSIRKGFRVGEFEKLAGELGLANAAILRSHPYRVVLSWL